MLKVKIGVLMVALALTTAGSEKMIVPLAFMALGIWLMRGAIEWK